MMQKSMLNILMVEESRLCIQLKSILTESYDCRIHLFDPKERENAYQHICRHPFHYDLVVIDVSPGADIDRMKRRFQEILCINPALLITLSTEMSYLPVKLASVPIVCVLQKPVIWQQVNSFQQIVTRIRSVRHRGSDQKIPVFFEKTLHMIPVEGVEFARRTRNKLFLFTEDGLKLSPVRPEVFMNEYKGLFLRCRSNLIVNRLRLFRVSGDGSWVLTDSGNRIDVSRPYRTGVKTFFTDAAGSVHQGMIPSNLRQEKL